MKNMHNHKNNNHNHSNNNTYYYYQHKNNRILQRIPPSIVPGFMESRFRRLVFDIIHLYWAAVVFFWGVFIWGGVGGRLRKAKMESEHAFGLGGVYG